MEHQDRITSQDAVILRLEGALKLKEEEHGGREVTVRKALAAIMSSQNCMFIKTAFVGWRETVRDLKLQRAEAQGEAMQRKLGDAEQVAKELREARVELRRKKGDLEASQVTLEQTQKRLKVYEKSVAKSVAELKANDTELQDMRRAKADVEKKLETANQAREEALADLQCSRPDLQALQEKSEHAMEQKKRQHELLQETHAFTKEELEREGRDNHQLRNFAHQLQLAAEKRSMSEASQEERIQGIAAELRAVEGRATDLENQKAEAESLKAELQAVMRQWEEWFSEFKENPLIQQEAIALLQQGADVYALRHGVEV